MSRDFKHFDADFRQKEKEFKKALKRAIPRKVGEVHRRGFKESFDLGRFNDIGASKWPEPERKNAPPFTPPTKSHVTRKTLVGKGGGHLKRGFKVDTLPSMVRIMNTKEYAKIHNEGGTKKTRVTKDLRKFAWAMYYKTKDESWKNLALTPKKVLIQKMPKRQFMGTSKKLNENANLKIIEIIERIIK